MKQLYEILLMCLDVWIFYKRMLLYVQKIVPLYKQFIIIKYTDLSVHSIWEKHT